MLTFKEFLEEQKDIDEAIKKKTVVRNGKRIRKKVDTRDDFKVVGGKSKRITPAERRRRSKAQKKGARKRKSGQKSANRKRQRSIRKRR